MIPAGNNAFVNMQLAFSSGTSETSAKEVHKEEKESEEPGTQQVKKPMEKKPPFAMDSNDRLREQWIDLRIKIIRKSEINLDNSKELGKGSYGRVITGNWHGTDVALKEIKARQGWRNNLVKREVFSLLTFSHENVIKLMGVILEHNMWYLIMEHFVSNNLHDILIDDELKASYNLTLINRVFLGVQMSKAVAFMHNYSPARVFNLDLKPENVLVSPLLELKLCDFGLSKTLNLSEEYHPDKEARPNDTLFFMAPELLVGNQENLDLAAVDV